MQKKRIAFQTLGCKLNFSETSSISRQFRDGGYEVVNFKDLANIYVINTCSVTGLAEKKCKQAISQAQRRNPNARIAVVGCFSQLKPEVVSALKGVDLILGSTSKFELFERLQMDSSKVSQIHVDEKEGQLTEFVPSFSSGDRTRSFVKVQDGCDYFCAYCTIPFARGHSRSGHISQVLDMVSEVLRQGIKEIILTGVNVGDFGRKQGETFLDLLISLEEVKRISRIRISSIEPDLLNNDIIELVAKSHKFLPHFHIPLQSGSNHILSLMKRRYPREVFENRVLSIRSLMPDACIAADVIVGFPGETDDDFIETLQFIEKLSISYVHVFTYSERPGTLAENLTNSVPHAIRTERSRLLHDLSTRKKHEFYERCIGKTFQVLFESDNVNGFMHGFTENYIKVKTPFDPKMINQIVETKLTQEILVY